MPEQERAELATRLLSSLPAILEDEDEGVAEALLREEAAEKDPSLVMSLEEFKAAMGR